MNPQAKVRTVKRLWANYHFALLCTNLLSINGIVILIRQEQNYEARSLISLLGACLLLLFALALRQLAKQVSRIPERPENTQEGNQ